MLSHLSFGVGDRARAGAFYDAALQPLGYVRVWDSEHGIGYGPPGGNDKLAPFVGGRVSPPSAGFHLALIAPSRAAVAASHAAAFRMGGRDDGAPGLRPDYSPTYYAALVFDPDGYKLEAVHQ